MTAFDNKEKAEENKYAHDKEMEFLINARYHRLLAGWAAEKIGLDVERAEEYKKQLVAGDLGKNDEEALFKKVRHDFLVHDIHMTDHDIREKMYNLLQDAKQQIMEK